MERVGESPDGAAPVFNPSGGGADLQPRSPRIRCVTSVPHSRSFLVGKPAPVLSHTCVLDLTPDCICKVQSRAHMSFTVRAGRENTGSLGVGALPPVTPSVLVCPGEAVLTNCSQNGCATYTYTALPHSFRSYKTLGSADPEPLTRQLWTLIESSPPPPTPMMSPTRQDVIGL